VHLGIVVVKDIQTLTWWVRARQKKRLLALHAADFDADTLAKAAMMKTLRKERADKEPSPVMILGKFDPDDFDTHEDTFLNLMSRRCLEFSRKQPLHYIVRLTTTPTAFGSDKEERMYQFPLEDSAFQMDNQTVCLPKA
jgi:hypothetical protein